MTIIYFDLEVVYEKQGQLHYLRDRVIAAFVLI